MTGHLRTYTRDSESREETTTPQNAACFPRYLKINVAVAITLLLP